MFLRSAKGSANSGFITVPATGSIFRDAETTLVVLLCGGDKGTQARDIDVAKKLAQEWSEQHD
jgi:hypothetical protein